MEINEYVRTKDGKIGKYIQPELGKPNITNGISFNEGANYGKHSKDIIDLIEVGDYVNGYYIENIRYQYDDGKPITILEPATGSNYFQTQIYEEYIKSILTHEQFEANAYKIEKEV